MNFGFVKSALFSFHGIPSTAPRLLRLFATTTMPSCDRCGVSPAPSTSGAPARLPRLAPVASLPRLCSGARRPCVAAVPKIRLSLVWIWINLNGVRSCATAGARSCRCGSPGEPPQAPSAPGISFPRRAPVMRRELYHARLCSGARPLVSRHLQVAVGCGCSVSSVRLCRNGWSRAPRHQRAGQA
jgi:hypothetical protein